MLPVLTSSLRVLFQFILAVAVTQLHLSHVSFCDPTIIIPRLIEAVPVDLIRPTFHFRRGEMSILNQNLYIWGVREGIFVKARPLSNASNALTNGQYDKLRPLVQQVLSWQCNC